MTDGVGNATTINSYDEYGIPAATNAGRFGYTGQAWFAGVGLYDYKARMYSPTLGRFMQTDPIGYAAGMNLYNYVGSDPVNFTDPWGLQEEESTGSDIVVRGCKWGKVLIRNSDGTTSCVSPSISPYPQLNAAAALGGRGAPPGLDGLQFCRINTVAISRAGKAVDISGNISFPDGQSEYLGAINDAWTGQFGSYNINTHMTEGPGGLIAHVSYGPGGRPRGDLGGPNLYLNTLVDAAPSELDYSLWTAGHEFGHSLGLGDRYSESGPNAGFEDEIMGAVNGEPNDDTVNSILTNCK